jgi:peptide/nickel transport system permease protein
MTGYLIRRILQAILVTFFVTVITLFLVHLFPGGPIRALLGPRASAQEVNYYNNLYGYNRPFYVQYGKWIWAILHGNLGYSVKLNENVSTLIGQYLPKTALLVLLGLVVSLVFGVPLGLYQAVKRYTAGDYVLTGVSLLGYATPTFFVGLLLIAWFSIDVHLFPSTAALSNPRSRVLPVVSYAFVLYALWSRYMRSSVMDNLVQEYVRTARAKGASERRVLWVHIFRNSLISIVTLLGLALPTMVAGAIFVEVVFNYPGMGYQFFQAAQADDVPVMLGFTLVATLATIIGNLLADISYAALDPRVRYS